MKKASGARGSAAWPWRLCFGGPRIAVSQMVDATPTGLRPVPMPLRRVAADGNPGLCYATPSGLNSAFRTQDSQLRTQHSALRSQDSELNEPSPRRRHLTDFFVDKLIVYS